MLSKVNMDIVFMNVDLITFTFFHYQMVVENLGKNPAGGLNDAAISAKAESH